jgi:hypothetical protein
LSIYQPSGAESAVFTVSITTAGGTFSSIGSPKVSILKYKTAINSRKFVLCSQNRAGSRKGEIILLQNEAEESNVHEVTNSLLVLVSLPWLTSLP